MCLVKKKFRVYRCEIMSDFYAKREEVGDKTFFQTLEGHTIDALLILRQYMKEYNGFLEDFCKRWNIPKDKLFRHLFYTVYLHDIAKLTKEFQRNIKNALHSAEYPHAYYAVFILQDIDNFEPLINDVPLEFAAIMGHHTQLYKNIYAMIDRTPTYLKDAIEEFIDDMENIYHRLEFDSFFEFKKLSLKKNALSPLTPLKMSREREKFIRNIVKKYMDDGKPSKNARLIKATYSLILSALQLSDDYSSLNFSETIKNMGGVQEEVDVMASVFLSPVSIIDPSKYTLKLPKDGREIVKKGKKLRNFQKEAEVATKKSEFLFAPCGRGKTEAALLWAFSVAERYKKNKIIFALPTQVTCNAMYERLKKEFGEENVALYHGKSLIKLKEERSENDVTETNDTLDIKEISSENFKGKVFFKPITVTTIDHIILSFVHGFSQSDFSLGNLLDSCVIFDEIHYYDRVTMGHLFDLFPLMDYLDIPHFLMSGTLPNFLTEMFDYPVLVDEEGLGYRPFKIKKYEETLVSRDEGIRLVNKDKIEEIIENYGRGMSQFVILNTVERAKMFYKELSGRIPAVLYHSQFTYMDRVSKEKEILRLEEERKRLNKPYLLIATQVIEVSLDISADIMYSELAPADALGQRAGRLNRGGKSWDDKDKKYILNIFKPESFRPYSEDIMEKTDDVLNKFDNIPVSYIDIKKMCDSIYSDYQAEVSNFKRYFFESIVFGHRPSEISTEDEEGRNFSTRAQDFLYINVIPCSIYKEMGEKAFSVQYMVKIPYYVFENDRENFKIEKYKKSWFIIAGYYYDSKTGFDFGRKEHCLNSNVL